MAIPHWLLMSVFFLLPLLAQVLAQGPGKLFHEVHESEECLPREGVALLEVGGCYTPRQLWSTTCDHSSHPTPLKCKSSGNFASYLCVFPGCSVSNSQPSVPENECPYVLTAIHVEPGFTLTIDPNSPDGEFFTIVGSELQLTMCVDYEVNLQGRDG